jgi:hypothetical protein
MRLPLPPGDHPIAVNKYYYYYYYYCTLELGNNDFLKWGGCEPTLNEIFNIAY